MSDPRDLNLVIGLAQYSDLDYILAGYEKDEHDKWQKPKRKQRITKPRKPAEGSQKEIDLNITLEEKDIELVLAQVNTTREKVIEALRKNDGDIVNAIMSLQF